MDAKKWEYMEHDGAYFRKRADSGLYMVDEVYWPTKGWVPYTGNASHRYRTSSFVDEGDVMRECAALDADLRRRAADAIAAAMRAIVGASAPPGPPPPPRTIEVIDGRRIMHLTPAEYDAWREAKYGAWASRPPNAPKTPEPS